MRTDGEVQFAFGFGVAHDRDRETDLTQGRSDQVAIAMGVFELRAGLRVGLIGEDKRDALFGCGGQRRERERGEQDKGALPL